MDKPTPQQALANLVAIAQRFTGYAWNEQAVILNSLRVLDALVNPPPATPTKRDEVKP